MFGIPKKGKMLLFSPSLTGTKPPPWAAPKWSMRIKAMMDYAEAAQKALNQKSANYKAALEKLIHARISLTMALLRLYKMRDPAEQIPYCVALGGVWYNREGQIVFLPLNDRCQTSSLSRMEIEYADAAQRLVTKKGIQEGQSALHYVRVLEDKTPALRKILSGIQQKECCGTPRRAGYFPALQWRGPNLQPDKVGNGVRGCGEKSGRSQIRL